MNRILLIMCMIALLAPSAFGAGDFYIDNTALGDGSGSSVANAYTSILAAMEASRSAGTTGYIKSTHVETVSARIDILSSGTSTSPITLTVDDGTHWPAAPSGTPVITMGENYIYASGDDFWIIDGGTNGIIFTGMSTYGVYLTNYLQGWEIKNATFLSFVGAADYGIIVTNASDVLIEDCVFDGNTIGVDGSNLGYGIRNDGVRDMTVRGCTFDGLASGCGGYGQGVIYVDCDFGSNEVNNNDVITYGPVARIILDSCIMNSHTAPNYYQSGIEGKKLTIFDFYKDGSDRDSFYFEGGLDDVYSDYTAARSGGADYAIVYKGSSASPGDLAPVEILEYRVDCDASEARTYEIYAKRTNGSATGLYLEVEYISGTERVIETTTSALTSAGTWYSIASAEITPTSDGVVFVRLKATIAGSSSYYYIDPMLIADDTEFNLVLDREGPAMAWLPESVAGQFILFN